MLKKGIESVCAGIAFTAFMFAGMVIDSSVIISVACLAVAAIMTGIVAVVER